MGETEEWDIDPEDTFSIILYKLNDEEERFDRIEIKSLEEIHPYLVFNNILLIIDTKGHSAYLWVGNEATVHMKFIAARIATQVRDLWGSMSTMHMHHIEEFDEPSEFKKLLQLP